MVAFARVVPDRLFEGQVLLAAKQVQVADRGILVGTLQDRGLGDFQAASQRERVGRVPFGRQHDLDDLDLGADQGDVERISGMAVAGVGDAGNVLQRRMLMDVAAPDRGHEDIGSSQVHDEHAGNQ